MYIQIVVGVCSARNLSLVAADFYSNPLDLINDDASSFLWLSCFIETGIERERVRVDYGLGDSFLSPALSSLRSLLVFMAALGL